MISGKSIGSALVNPEKQLQSYLFAGSDILIPKLTFYMSALQERLDVVGEKPECRLKSILKIRGLHRGRLFNG
jgi:hypothetical protein